MTTGGTNDKGGASAPPAGASAEVLAHHARQHPCPPDAPCLHVPCPCGGALALVCGDCGEPVYVVLLRPDAPPCVHARELIT